MHPSDRPDCFSAHLGLWAIDPSWMALAVECVANGTLPTLDARRAPEEDQMYAVLPGRVAVVNIVGAMQKGDSKFGGTSTVRTRRAIRQATQDASVESILLRVESPGGHVSGTAELAEEVARAQSVKPVETYAEDLMASAGYWVGSAGSHITANRSARIGSIGVMTQLVDSSERMEREGIRVIPIASGPMKAAGMPGTPVTDDVVAAVQELVDDAAEMFVGTVSANRGLVGDRLAAISTGALFPARRALSLGLIDEIGTFESAVARLQMADDSRARARARINIARAR